MPADLALLLAFDASASVTYDEFALIAGGIAEALRAPEIALGLTTGRARASLCALLVFSGRDAQETMIPWTRLATPDDVAAFAQRVDDVPRTVPAGLTALGSALLAAETLLTALHNPPARRIVDLAGDGASNDGPDPAPIRDRLASAGVTINGLCVLHEEPDLVDAFTRSVTGGPDSFALPCPALTTPASPTPCAASSPARLPERKTRALPLLAIPTTQAGRRNLWPAPPWTRQGQRPWTCLT